ncbi:TerD family protein [Kineococcus rubinsiae]|uniref:TerD family protein n=1 Tax=Kineococcus rubinsiae TaxID=2609562 RepID=UPI001430B0F6|nr:TerD family protein [Kineococcus rubinsiae]NIZ90897.1 TerD family protein [Kineococcus rubinsiae]
MDDTSLLKGANRLLSADSLLLRAVIGWDEGVDGAADVDASALLLDADRRVRSDEDFVFYNQTTSSDGSVEHTGRSSTDSGAEERIRLDLARLPSDVHFVVLAASVTEGTVADVASLRLDVTSGDGVVASIAATGGGTETVLVLGELYRRGEDWKVRAVCQGWEDGLSGLATDFGVSVADSTGEDDDEVGALEPEEPAALVEQDVDPLTVELADSVDDLPGSEELVEVVEAEPPTPAAASSPDVPSTSYLPLPPAAVESEPGAPGPAAADVPPSPVVAAAVVPASSTARVAGRAGGVRTRKAKTPLPVPPPLRLRLKDSWQPARLFSISGVGSGEEQEKRATSALLATMTGVRPFARSLTTHFGAPAGLVETYLEVPFHLGESTVIPDGVMRVQRANRDWTGLLEVKTGDGQLQRQQVENYLDVARDQGFDAVITLSNEISPGDGEHPVEVDRRKLRGKVALFHLSWSEVLHEARMTLTHRGVADAHQAWLLNELIRYLEHPRSGTTGFEDMGPAWVTVREAVAAGTLRAADRKAPAVAQSWIRLVRQLRLTLTAELGVSVTHVLPRRIASDPVARLQATTAQLAGTGQLEATLRVPGAVGPVTVVADVRTSQVRTSVRVPAPQEGGAQRRVTWLLRQLKEAPADLLIEASFTGRPETTCEQLRVVRENPLVLVSDKGADIAAFTLIHGAALGTKRSGVKNAFVPSVTGAVQTFYRAVVQPLRPWVAAAPKLPDELTGMAPDDADDVPEADPADEAVG